MAGWKMGLDWVSRFVFPTENGDIPASYVSLLEGNRGHYITNPNNALL